MAVGSDTSREANAFEFDGTQSVLNESAVGRVAIKCCSTGDASPTKVTSSRRQAAARHPA